MKILLALDSSASSVVALEDLATRPWPPGTNIEVLNVVEPWDVPALMEGLNRSATELLNRALRRLTDAKVKATTFTLCGEPKALIIDRAGDISADLVVVGSRGFIGLTKFRLGSVAAAVARFAPCSVEIARPSVRDEDNRNAIRILLATDGSECSEFAARQVAERPWPIGSEVHILSVVELSVPLFRMPYPPYFDHRAMEDPRSRGDETNRRGSNDRRTDCHGCRITSIGNRRRSLRHSKGVDSRRSPEVERGLNRGWFPRAARIEPVLVGQRFRSGRIACELLG